MMYLVKFLFFLLAPITLFGQFFYTQTKPLNKYRVDTVSTNTDLGHSFNPGVSGKFAMAGWFNLKDQNCEFRVFGNSEFRMAIIQSGKRLGLKFLIKDSINVEGSTYDANISDLIPLARINTHLAVSYDGTNDASGIKLYINGDKLTADIDKNIAISVTSASNLTVGNASCPLEYYNLRLYNDTLSDAQAEQLASSVDATISLTPTFNKSGTSKYRQSGFLNQVFTTRKVNNFDVFAIPVWGMEKELDLSYLYITLDGNSTPMVIYNEYENRTYVVTTARGGPGLSRAGYVLYYDHNTSTVTVQGRVNPQSDLTADKHQVTFINVAKDSSMIMGMEDMHSSPIFIHKYDTPLPRSMDSTYVTGPASDLDSYPRLYAFKDSLYLLTRRGSALAYLKKSTDNGATFGPAIAISNLSSSAQWNYHNFYTDDSHLYFGGMIRNPNSNYEAVYLLKSHDGLRWCNLDSTYCKNVTGGSWNTSEIRANALIDTVTNGSGQNVFTGGTLTDTAGRVHILTNNLELGKLVYTLYDGTSITKDTLTLTGGSKMIYKGGDNFEVFSLEVRASNNVLVKYSSDNFLFNLDAGTVVYTFPENVQRLSNMQITPNQSPGQEIVIVGQVVLSDDTEQPGLWFYKYNPWNQL